MKRNKDTNSELFVIPRQTGDYLLYSPLNHKIGEINSAGVNILAKYLDEELLNEKESEFIRELQKQKFIHEKQLKRPVFPDNYKFMPAEVTLFPTSGCNLRCRYCYADAGRKSSKMSLEVAKAAIDFVAKNAGLAGLPKFAIGFHGGGEPTLEWRLVKSSVEYAYKVADEKGMEVEVFAATNGMFTKKQREYLVQRFTTLNISVDGPPDIQDYFRPRTDGTASSKIIYDNLKFLDEKGFRYGVRATITEKTACRIEEIVRWFKAEFNISFLHIEPVWDCGRCKTSGEKPPADSEFIKYFLQGLKTANEIGVNLVYSGLRVDSLLSKFCGAAGDGFNVLPEGIVTSCYEITDSDDPRAEVFHYGQYDFTEKKFVFHEDKINRLLQLSVENIPYCKDCFCKWHCGGDCLSKVFEASNSFYHEGSPRCEINRTLSLIQLEKMLSH